MEVSLDGEKHQSQVHGTYRQLDTRDTVLLGTANNNVLVQDLTRGHFTQGFQVYKYMKTSGAFSHDKVVLVHKYRKIVIFYLRTFEGLKIT